MRDIGEWPAVQDRRIAFQCLDKIGLDGFGQQHRHRAVGFKIPRGDGLAVAGIADDDSAKPLFKVSDIFGEAKNRHDFGRHGDVESALTRITVCHATDRLDDVAQRAIIDVHHSPPDDAAHVDIERVAPVDMIIDHCSE